MSAARARGSTAAARPAPRRAPRRAARPRPRFRIGFPWLSPKYSERLRSARGGASALAVSLRGQPVRSRSDLDGQPDFQLGGSFHHLDDESGDLFDFLIRRFENELVV